MHFLSAMCKLLAWSEGNGQHALPLKCAENNNLCHLACLLFNSSMLSLGQAQHTAWRSQWQCTPGSPACRMGSENCDQESEIVKPHP